MVQEDEWQLGPFTFGRAEPGFVLGSGCGIGVGVGFPLVPMDAIPIIGPAVTGVLQSLGVKLGAGIGCGVGLGFGVGKGIVLKPSVTEELAALAGRATAFVQQAYGLQQSVVKTEAGSVASSDPSMLQQSGTSGPVHVTVGLPQAAMTSSVPAAPTGNVPGKDAGVRKDMSAGAGKGSSAAATSQPGLGLSIAGLKNASFVLSPGPSKSGSHVLVKGQGGVGALPSLLAAQQVLSTAATSLLIAQQQQLEGLGAAAGVMQAQLGEMADRLGKQERATAELRTALVAAILLAAGDERAARALQRRNDEGAGDVAAKQPAGREGGKGRGKQRGGS